MHVQFVYPNDLLWRQVLHQTRHDFYHLPAYTALEAANLNNVVPEAVLITEDDKLFFIPYLIRSCSHLFEEDEPEGFDVISPYGYPGVLMNDTAIADPDFLPAAIVALQEAFLQRNICSAFFRLHPLLNPIWQPLLSTGNQKINGSTVAIDLNLSEAELWQQTRSEHRTKINRSKRNGLTVKIIDLETYLDEFIEVYEETMSRVNASSSYYFNRDYYLQLHQILEGQLHLHAVFLEDMIISASLFTECCGIVQYHLGGTRTSHLKSSPNVLLMHCVTLWAKSRGNHYFHLGGGVGSAEDSLFHFKAGFSKQTFPFSTLRLIIDSQKYQHLTHLRAKQLEIPPEQLNTTNFFPTYRAPIA